MLGKLLRERARARAIAKLTAGHEVRDPGCRRFVDQAAEAFAAPMTLLTLLRHDQMLIHASKGVDMESAPRKESFCTQAIEHGGDIFEVCDAAADPRFNALPFVTGETHLRYYIGAPLVLDSGVVVGMLCVLDTRARAPASPDQRAYLIGLARQAVAALERGADTFEAVAA